MNASRAADDMGVTSPLLMTAVSGCIDAHLFLRYQSFAFAQTGNVVFLAVAVVQGAAWARYLWPLAAYVAGLAAAETLRAGRPGLPRSAITAILTGQVVVFAVLALVPAGTPAAVFLVVLSFVGAIRLDFFRSAGGLPVVTIATTGNLLRLMQSAASAIREPSRDHRWGLAISGLVVLAFAAGALVGAYATTTFGTAGLWAAVIMEALALVCYLMAGRRRFT